MDFENTKKYFNAGKEINKYLKLNFYFLKCIVCIPRKSYKKFSINIKFIQTNGKEIGLKL